MTVHSEDRADRDSNGNSWRLQVFTSDELIVIVRTVALRVLHAHNSWEPGRDISNNKHTAKADGRTIKDIPMNISA